MKLLKDEEVVFEEHDDPSDDDVPEESHKNLLNAISYMYKKQRIDLPKRSEAAKDISEFHLSSNNETGGSKVFVNDLLTDLKEKTTHKDTNRKVKAAQNKSRPLPKPLESIKAKEISRSIGYQQVKGKLNKWDTIVERNKLATQLAFPLKEQIHRKEAPNFLTQYKEQTDLEKAMAAVLNQSEVAKEERELENDLSRLSIEEMIERRQMMAKMKARESYRIAKAVRQNKIKSKKYHRVLKKERIKQELKDFEELKKTDPEAALTKLQEIERARAEERISLRHRNTGKWAKSRAIRAKYDVEARIQLSEQLAKSRELTRKVQPNKSDHSESEGEVEEDIEYEGDEDPKQNSDSGNPWLKKSTIVDNFLSGYKKFWSDKNKINDTNSVSSKPEEDSTEDTSQLKFVTEASPDSDKHSSNTVEESVTAQPENSEKLHENHLIISNDTEEQELNSGDEDESNDESVQESSDNEDNMTEMGETTRENISNGTEEQELNSGDEVESNDESVQESSDNEGNVTETGETPRENISKDVHENHLITSNDTEEQELNSGDEDKSNYESVQESSDNEDNVTEPGETPRENISKDVHENHLITSNDTEEQKFVDEDESNDESIEKSSNDGDTIAETTNINISKDVLSDSEDEVIDVCSLQVNTSEEGELNVQNISEAHNSSNCEPIPVNNRSPGKHSPGEGILKMRTNKKLAKKPFKLNGSPFQSARTKQIIFNNEMSEVYDTSDVISTIRTNCGSWEVLNENPPQPINNLPKQKKRKQNQVEKNLDDMFDDAEYAVKTCVLNAGKKRKLSGTRKSQKSKTGLSKKPVSPGVKFIGPPARNTGIDEALLELNEEGISSGVNDLQSIKEKLDSVNVVENKELEVDPNKYINVKPQKLVIEPSQLEQGVEDDDDDEDPNAKQKMQLMEAFADEDIANEFSKEKEDLKNKSKAQEIDLTMPGWGSWGGTGIEDNPKSKRRRRRFVVRLPRIPRRDENRELVIINEDPVTKLREQMVNELPYPFTSVRDFEASIRAPIGKNWVPERAHRKLIEPPVVTKMGTIIEPMNSSFTVLKKDKLLKGIDLFPTGAQARNNKQKKFSNQRNRKPYNKS